MSKIIPPMVSSSPPPMDDNLDEEDDDDEFGSFSTANFSYNLDITQPSKPSKNEDWEGNVKHQYDMNTFHLAGVKNDGEAYNDIAHRNGTHSNLRVVSETYLPEEDEEVEESFPRKMTEVSNCQEMQQDNTSQDSVASVATDSGLCSASQDSEGTSPLPTAKECIASIPASNNISQDESSSGDETLVKSCDTDLGGQLPPSSEMPNNETFNSEDKTLSEHTYILNDLNSIEERLKDSKQLSKENVQDQSPISSINNKFTDIPAVDDSCDVSDFQAVQQNILSSEPTTGVFCNLYSPISDVKTNADETIVDQLPNIASSDSQGKLLMNNNLNDVNLGCDINVPNESSRHFPDKVHLGIGLESGNIGECDDAPVTLENVATGAEVPFSSESHESDDEFADFAYSEPLSLPVPLSAPVIKPNESFGSDDEFADFAFSEPPSLPVPSSAPVIKPNKSFESDDEFADFAFNEAPSLPVALSAPVIKPSESFVSGEEFADFACSVVPPVPPVVGSEERCWADESAMQLPTVSADVNQLDDDFDDFETASFSSASITTGVVDQSQLTSRLENVVTTLFPGPSGVRPEMSEATLLPSRRMVESNPVWGDLRDVDTSHALSYQWVSSSANKMLLSALGIDTRNILFGSKWNVAVPRFAANLGISPLEPVRAQSPPPLQPTCGPVPKSSMLRPEASTSAGPEATVPDAQFDWNSSGLVNPLDCAHSTLLDPDYLNSFDNLTLPTSDSHAAVWRLASMEKDGHRPTTSSHRKINHGQQLVTSTRGRQGLSSEAVKVLESLPNLSFLRTKTLIFPPPGQALTH